jgi:hypothetical protein
MHNISTTTTYFIFLAIFCVGAAIGALIERTLKRRSTPPPPPAGLPSNINTLAEAEDVEVLRAWRTRSNKIWLEMDSKRLNDKAALQPGQYQRLLNLVIDLRPWLETARPAAPAPVATQPPMRAAATVAATTPPSMLTAATAPAAPPPVQAGKKDGKRDEEKPPAVVLDSIIQQIDKVLQAKLATSAFNDRGIQLVEGPGGIVIVKDGINRYEGIDGLPDPEIKALIRQAVTDWEKGSK